MALYHECNTRNSLPEAGGINDQPEELMKWFRFIDEIIARHKREQAEQEKLRRDLNHA